MTTIEVGDCLRSTSQSVLILLCLLVIALLSYKIFRPNLTLLAFCHSALLLSCLDIQDLLNFLFFLSVAIAVSHYFNRFWRG